MENKEFVGWFTLWPESETVAELGYRLRRQDWGQGLASEGAAALINWGFGTAGYERITSTAMAAHKGSWRVMEKIGMFHVKTVPSNETMPGSEQGEVWFDLLRSQWSGA